ncbi:MAG: NAD-dependent epimerase/dehydratase family protein [Myxococcota bacterium]
MTADSNAPPGVLIVGCGFTGMVLAARLGFAGRPVWGTTRTEAHTSIIRSRGSQAVIFDGVDVTPLRALRGRIGAVVDCIPPEIDRDGAVTDSTRAILDAVSDFGLRAFVYVSATSVYGNQEGATVTEATEVTPDSPRGQARLVAEAKVLGSGLPGMVLRPSGIYGPGRSQLHRVAEGRYKLVGDGSALTNRIHVADLASLLEAAIDRGKAGAVYLGTDQRPATQAEVVDHIVERYGLPRPPTIPLEEARVRMTRDVFAMITGSKRLDPTWTLAELGVRLRYPDYEAGLADVWRRDGASLRELMATAG